jgi:hypothetical protein
MSRGLYKLSQKKTSRKPVSLKPPRAELNRFQSVENAGTGFGIPAATCQLPGGTQ